MILRFSYGLVPGRMALAMGSSASPSPAMPYTSRSVPCIAPVLPMIVSAEVTAMRTASRP